VPGKERRGGGKTFSSFPGEERKIVVVFNRHGQEQIKGKKRGRSSVYGRRRMTITLQPHPCMGIKEKERDQPGGGYQAQYNPP